MVCCIHIVIITLIILKIALHTITCLNTCIPFPRITVNEGRKEKVHDAISLTTYFSCDAHPAYNVSYWTFVLFFQCKCSWVHECSSFFFFKYLLKDTWWNQKTIVVLYHLPCSSQLEIQDFLTKFWDIVCTVYRHSYLGTLY